MPQSDLSLASSPPLLARPARLPSWLWRAATAASLASLAVVVFLPTLRNQFLLLGFDDPLILDTPALHDLSWANALTWATEFDHALYMPLTQLSLAINYHFSGVNPWGYHLTNLLLHALAAALLYIFLCPIVPSARVAALAAAIFAVHPLQMEAVSVAIQRKTVLAATLWLLTLVLYQRWYHKGGRGWYASAVVCFLAAALAKPMVVTLPLLLLLYSYVFSGRLRLRPTIPFFAIASLIAWITVRAHAAAGAIRTLHGGSLLAHLLMVSRVALEELDAAFMPVNLAPGYYYPHQAIYQPVNFLALGLIPALCFYVTVHRSRYPWTCFCLWWFILALLPESNLVPLTELRANRFLYFALPAFALWVALGWERLFQAAVRTRWRLPVHLLAPAAVGVLAIICYRSAAVWHDDVSAWTEVVERNPWCAVAHQMLGRAYRDSGDAADAERELQTALRISNQLPEPHLYLAELYAARGATALARSHLQRFLELAPGDPRGSALMAAIPSAGGA